MNAKKRLHDLTDNLVVLDSEKFDTFFHFVDDLVPPAIPCQYTQDRKHDISLLFDRLPIDLDCLDELVAVLEVWVRTDRWAGVEIPDNFMNVPE